MSSTLLPLLLLSLLPSTFAQSSTPISTGTPALSAYSGTATATVNPNSINSAVQQTAATSGLPSGVTIPDLSLITMGATSLATVALDTTYPAGATPTAVASTAPALPSLGLVVANYPSLDTIPDTNSAEVQGWLSSINFSNAPGYAPTNGTVGATGRITPSCAADPTAVNDGRCWWSCGQCTRSTDVTVCPNKYDWGVSYDDGPTPWTPLLLDYLNEVNLSTTFFIVGSRALSYPTILQSEYMSGHQISVHTWSHPYLTTLTNEQVVAELGWTMKVIKDVTGVTPNTFRPPYGDIDDRVRWIAAQMGLTPIIWTKANGVEFDTTDWNIPAGTATGESALAKFDTILNVAADIDTGFIVLEHDLYPQTIELAVGYILPQALANGTFKLMSINDCLGWDLADCYIETSSNDTTFTNPDAATTGSVTSFPPVRGASATGGSSSSSTIMVTTTNSAGSTITSASRAANSAATTSSTSGAIAISSVNAIQGVFALAGVAIGAILVL